MARELDVQPVLLGFLIAGPKHAYELHQEFARELGRVWRVGRSKLYTQLKQIAERGWATIQVETPANRPPRQIYHLTPTGRQVFFDWLHQPASHLRHFRLAFPTRLYFFRRLALPGLDKLVAEQKTLLEAQVESLDRAAGQANDDFWRLVLTFRHSQTEAVVQWLDLCVQFDDKN